MDLAWLGGLLRCRPTCELSFHFPNIPPVVWSFDQNLDRAGNRLPESWIGCGYGAGKDFAMRMAFGQGSAESAGGHVLAARVSMLACVCRILIFVSATPFRWCAPTPGNERPFYHVRV